MRFNAFVSPVAANKIKDKEDWKDCLHKFKKKISLFFLLMLIQSGIKSIIILVLPVVSLPSQRNLNDVCFPSYFHPYF